MRNSIWMAKRKLTAVLLSNTTWAKELRLVCSASKTDIVSLMSLIKVEDRLHTTCCKWMTLSGKSCLDFTHEYYQYHHMTVLDSNQSTWFLNSPLTLLSLICSIRGTILNIWKSVISAPYVHVTLVGMLKARLLPNNNSPRETHRV